jgi:hypothetical protein
MTEYKEKLKAEGITGSDLNWNNKEPKGLAAKKDQARLRGSIKAIDGAVNALIFGDADSDDPTRRLIDWDDQREAEANKRFNEEYEREWKKDMGDTPSKYLDHQTELSEPAKALAATMDEVEPQVEGSSWTQKLMNGDPEVRAQWLEDVIASREYNERMKDCNLDGDDEDETDEDE